MPRQLLSGTVLLGAALLLAGKGPPAPGAPSSPVSAPGCPRRATSDVPPRRRLPCPQTGPAAPRLSAGAGGHLPPILPSPLGRAGGRDPRFLESRETPHPERSLSSGSPAVCLGSSAPGVPEVRSRGASPPPGKAVVPTGRGPSPGHRGQPARATSEPVHHGKKACLGCRAGFFPPRFVSKCQPLPALSVKRKRCPFPSQKSSSCCLLPGQGGGAEHRSRLPAGGGRTDTRRGYLWRVGRSCSPAPASRNAACAGMDQRRFAFLNRVLFYFERVAVPAGPERRGGERVPLLSRLVTWEQGCGGPGKGQSRVGTSHPSWGCPTGRSGPSAAPPSSGSPRPQRGSPGALRDAGQLPRSIAGLGGRLGATANRGWGRKNPSSRRGRRRGQWPSGGAILRLAARPSDSSRSPAQVATGSLCSAPLRERLRRGAVSAGAVPARCPV